MQPFQENKSCWFKHLLGNIYHSFVSIFAVVCFHLPWEVSCWYLLWEVSRGFERFGGFFAERATLYRRHLLANDTSWILLLLVVTLLTSCWFRFHTFGQKKPSTINIISRLIISGDFHGDDHLDLWYGLVFILSVIIVTF